MITERRLLLLVAVPVLLLLHMLESAADRRAQGMHSSTMLLLERLPHQHRQEHSEAVHYRQGVINAV